MNSMITVKTAELTGRQLDWAVNDILLDKFKTHQSLVFTYACKFSTDWRIAGPIIERERIGTYSCEGIWYARADEHGKFFTTGETLLIAAMRAFVVRKRGLTVDVPEVLS